MTCLNDVNRMADKTGDCFSAPPAPSDATPPDTSITGMADNAYINSPSISISFSGTDETSAQAALQYSYMLDSGAWSAWSSSSSASLSGLSDGAHAFSVKARDEAGNEDSTPAQVSFTVDTSGPVITLSSDSAVTIVSGKVSQSVTITGNVASVSGVASLTYAVSDEYGKSTGSGAVTPSSNGDFSFTVNVLSKVKKNDSDGRNYTVTLTSVDMAGNSSTSTVNVVIHRPSDKGKRKK